MSERILAVDTCFGACSAALVEGERVLANRHVAMERGHAEALAPMVDELMRHAGLGFAAIDKLAVTTGPGSFTGQRVGLAFMRGMRVALNKPLIGITSLAAMAAEARAKTGCAIAAAVHDAKRDEVYIEVVGGPPQLMATEDAIALLRTFEAVALAGTAAARLAPSLSGAVETGVVAPDAVWVARLASQTEFSSTPRPLYLRPPDAKLPAGR